MHASRTKSPPRRTARRTNQATRAHYAGHVPRTNPSPRWTEPGPMSFPFYFARALEIIHHYGLWSRPSGFLAGRGTPPEYRIIWGITESMPDCQSTHGTGYASGQAALRALRRAGRKLASEASY